MARLEGPKKRASQRVATLVRPAQMSSMRPASNRGLDRDRHGFDGAVAEAVVRHYAHQPLDVEQRALTAQGNALIESSEKRPYLMSFSTGGLFINESVAIAQLHVRLGNWDSTLLAAQERGVIPVRKASSARRSTREIVNRLKCLSPSEENLLVEGDRSEQIALLWLATCRAYRFVAEFAIEVLSDRFLSLRTTLSYEDFERFLSAKEQWSAKLAALSSSTRAKLRAVLFRLMREAEIVSRDNQILGAMLSSRVLAILAVGNLDELRYFPGAERQLGGGE